ncbi:MAG: hypothetical protein JNL09_01615 [Anaerolineales bacterium]|nr:hypothetical protein [Anaerolineales bacterium]
MSEDPNLSWKTQADFASARLKALFRNLLAFLTGQPNDLLAFEAVREKLHIGGPIYRGVRTVSIAQIVGSVDRYRDFDRAFLPKQDFMAERWQKVTRAWYQDISLPPILLYKVGEVYFVVDGHHRVSVAREKGQEAIEAEVRECAVRVPLTAEINPDDLEVLGARAEFLERTNLDRLRPDARVAVTILGGYERMLEHIAVHRYFMGLEFQRDVADEEAVAHWYDTVYLPIMNVIRESEILAAFTGRTEADFYLWVLDHRHYLVAQGQAHLVEPGQAAEEFLRAYFAGQANPTEELKE